MTIQINDPWFENLYTKEFGANTNRFIAEIKMLLVEKHQREAHLVSLLQQYKDSQISIGKIAQNLHIDREKVLALLTQHGIDFVDYDMGEEKQYINDFMREIQK